MAPSNPKRPPRRGPPAPPAPKRKEDVELPFDDQDVMPLQEDDPRPQRVPQYPATARRSSHRDEDDAPDPSVSGDDVGDPGFEPAFLYVERGPGAGQLVPIRQGVLLIGRASTSGLRLQHPSISRRHAQLHRKGERFFIRDLASQNGTYVNQVRLDKELEIFPGDEIVMGTAQLRVRGAANSRSGRYEEDSAPHRGRASGNTTSITGIALTAGAVGFGLAAIVMFAWFKLSRGPVYENLSEPPQRPTRAAATRPPPPPPPAEAPAEAPADAPAEAPAETPKPDELAANAPEEPQPAAEAPSAEPSSDAVELTSPEPEEPRAEQPKAQVVALRAQRTPKQAPTKGAPSKATQASSEEDVPEESIGSIRSEPAVLARYESGNVAAAIELAKRRGAKELVAQLTRFQALYQAAQEALRAQDQATALKNLNSALKLDEQISSGWGKYNAELRRQLSGLHTMAGMRALSSDPATAQRELSAALKYDPENEAAKAQLQKLTGAEGSPKAPAPRSGSAKDKIDAAFGN